MKLLFVQDNDWLKRNPVHQHHLAEKLSLRGHEIRVIDHELLWGTQGKRELFSRREIFNKVCKIYDNASTTVIRPGIIKLPLLNYVSLVFSHRQEIRRQINEFKPDAIIGWGILSSYLAMKAARRHNIPFLYYWIDVLDRLIPLKPFQIVGRLIESRTLKRADRVLVISDKLRHHVIELGALPERTQVLRGGINTDQFDPDSDSRAVRNQYGLSDKDTVLLFMGWLYNFSGLKEVALQLAQIDNPGLKLLIVGEGDAYKELEKVREEHNLQDRLILTGKKPYQEIPGFVAAADICLLPAYPDEKIMQDIVPLKMYEYMAMRKPVISTRLPGVAEEFGENNGVAYVDKPEDVVMKALELTQNNRVKELGQKARSFVERYSWESITDEFETILREVVNAKRLMGENKNYAQSLLVKN